MSAKNERLKIQANFWNGLAIASAAAGIVIPTLQAYGNDELWKAEVFPHLSKLAYNAFLPAAVGIFLAFLFHGIAKDYANRITDD